MASKELLESIDSGSNYHFGEKMNRPSNPKSLFDLSHLVTTTIPNAGRVFPITMFEALPGDDHDINVDALLRVLPSVVPLYSRQRLYVYGFYSRYSDLCKNWQVFMDKGYTGNVNISIPYLHGSRNADTSNSAKVEPDSLADCFGLPIGADCIDLVHNIEDGAKLSVLPLMMYLRIYRDYFMNKNEFINDRVMLPDDDADFRINSDGKLQSAVNVSKDFYFNPFDLTPGTDTVDVKENFDLIIDDSGDYHFGGFYHEYPDDYFMSALPFTQRGNTPTLDTNVDLSDIRIDLTNSFNKQALTSDSVVSGSSAILRGETHTGYNADNISVTESYLYNSDNSELANTSFINAFKRAQLTGNNIDLGITLEDIRKLAVQQTELEILARTDGSYAQFGLSFFGEISKAAHDYRPTYIGGTYKNIVFTEVLQTSGSSVGTTDPNTNSPLGAYSGHGITGITQGRIGHIHCDDYGIVMILGCIMPDIYYSQGLDRIWTDSLQAEKYLPQRTKLGMQPIYNKELYYAGNNGNDVGEDNYLWAYQNPFDHLRYMPNRIKGKIADPNSESFYPYTQSRKFESLPNWGKEFSKASDVRQDYLFAPSEDAYTCQFSMNIRSVREMPYKSIPASII